MSQEPDYNQQLERERPNLYNLFKETSIKYMLFPKEHGQQTGVLYKLFQSEKQINIPEFNKGIIMFDKITKKNCPTQPQFQIITELYLQNTKILEIVLNNVGLIIEKFIEFEQLFPRNRFINAFLNILKQEKALKNIDFKKFKFNFFNRRFASEYYLSEIFSIFEFTPQEKVKILYYQKQINAFDDSTLQNLASEFLQDNINLFFEKINQEESQQQEIQYKRMEKCLENQERKASEDHLEFMEESEQTIKEIIPKNSEEEQLNRLRKHFFTSQPEDSQNISKKYDKNVVANVLKYTLSLCATNFYSPLYQVVVIMKKMSYDGKEIEQEFLEKMIESAPNIKKGFAQKLILSANFGQNFIFQFIQSLIKAQRLDIAQEFCTKFSQDPQNFPEILQHKQVMLKKDQFLDLRDHLIQIFKSLQQEKQTPKPQFEVYFLENHHNFFQKLEKNTQDEHNQLISILLEKHPLLQSDNEDLPKKYRLQISLAIVRLFNLNLNLFPTLKKMEKNQPKKEKKPINKLQKILKENTWEKVEEIFRGNYTFLVQAIEHFISKQKYDIAFTLIKRNQINYYDISNLTQTILSKEEQNFTYLANTIFEKDDYRAIEEILEKKPKNHFLNMKDDFNVTINFIDQSQQQQSKIDENCHMSLSDAIQELEQENMFGIDAEWEHNAANLVQDTQIEDVEIVQISTQKKAYIIDLSALKKNQQVQNFFYNFFSNPKKTIIGFGVQNDITKIKKHLRIATKEENDQNGKQKQNQQCNTIDLQLIAKSLPEIQNNPEKEVNSLNDLVKFLIEKPISKCEQFSNWLFRPLRKSQLHYAAMDAYICIHLYNLIQSKFNEKK